MRLQRIAKFTYMILRTVGFPSAGQSSCAEVVGCMVGG